jgi:DNA polymerase III alpha subunit (gram-positive type)
MRELIFVDTETTGLNPKTDELVELSWAYETGPIKTLYFGVEEVPEFIDELIKFTARDLAGKKSEVEEVSKFIEASLDQTMVAASPAFDQSFLKANAIWHFHYRMLDIESYAMAKLALDEIPSMKTIYGELIKRGYSSLPRPDHSAAGDVEAMRSIYKVLRYI